MANQHTIESLQLRVEEIKRIIQLSRIDHLNSESITVTIKDIPDNVLCALAEKESVKCFEPGMIAPYYWALIKTDYGSIELNGIQKTSKTTFE